MHVTDAELINLATSHDIISIGMLADDLRRQRHGSRTTFVRVADVGADPGAPVLSPPAAGELRIVGVPASGAAAVERVREVAAAAHGASVSAFSLADLEQLAAVEGVTLRALLEDLSAAGLELVAEAPFDRLADPHRSIEEVNIAGLALARLTVDQSPSPDPLPLLKAVAELQRGVGVVRVFAPLPRRVNPAAPTTGYEDVRCVALARLVVDNVPSIQVDWSLYGPKLAQVALTVGADDIDAVSAEDDTTEGRRRAPLEEIRRNIRAAGQEPVERNGRFEALRPLEPLGAVPGEVEGRHAQDERAR
jgi:aminodeoxyfutalosine synthase